MAGVLRRAYAHLRRLCPTARWLRTWIVLPVVTGIIVSLITSAIMRMVSGGEVRAPWNGAGFRVVAADKGLIYAVDYDGALWRFRHETWLTGSEITDPGRRVGSGWGRFTWIFPGSGRSLYGVEPSGRVYWHRDVDGNGRFDARERRLARVALGGGRPISVSGVDGVIYALTDRGLLFRCPHADWRTGRHDDRRCEQSASGWGAFRRIFAEAPDRIWAADGDPDSFGRLFRYVRTASGLLLRRPDELVGRGWSQESQSVAVTCPGVFYSLGPGGKQLWWHRYTYDGPRPFQWSDWSNGGEKIQISPPLPPNATPAG